MQGESPASLPIGTQVSAKYKGAFCEAKVRSVSKQVRIRVTFKNGLGSTTLSDEYIQSEAPVVVGAVVQARHPDKQDYLEATVNKIQDQSQYTVVFDDGDITTLRRNALCIKSGKHFSASESLDNLPLTHPEHFSTPVAGKKRRRKKFPRGGGSDYDSSSETEDMAVSSSYLPNIGRVVWAENTDKKGKTKETWFPALIVAPSASDAVKIDTKEEYLIRSFKDGRYYTVSKKDTKKFHRDSARNMESSSKDGTDKALTYIEKGDLPSLWDTEILFNMGEESTTESSETEDDEDDDDADEESPEEKDRLVAELYKHMEDRGAPINRTPSIVGKDVDLYRLFRLVMKMGGHSRVTNNNSWKQVALKLGFDTTTWCVNQVRVHYKRYLQSFEEMKRTLGCTMNSHPRQRQSSGGGRSQIRGKHRFVSSGKASNDSEGDAVSTGSKEDLVPLTTTTDFDKKQEPEPTTVSAHVPEVVKEPAKESAKPVKETTPKPKKPKKVKAAPVTTPNEEAPKEQPISPATESSEVELAAVKTEPVSPPTSTSKRGRSKENDEEKKMTTRPRRDSTSSMAAAMQVKAQKDTIGEKKAVVRIDKTEADEVSKKMKSPVRDVKEKAKKKDEDLPATPPTKPPKTEEKQEKQPPGPPPGERRDHGPKGKRRIMKKKGEEDAAEEEDESKQHLTPNIDVQVGDRIKVFYIRDTIYDAKVMKREDRGHDKWPRYYVHYQGWNARYDEWIKRSRIAENLSWSKERTKKNSTSSNSSNASSAGSETGKTFTEGEKTPAKETTKKEMKKEETKEKVVKTKPKPSTPATSSSTKSQPPANDSGSSRAGTPSSVTSRSSRTGSPMLKRQSSRSSVKRESESEEDSDHSLSNRKSSRLKRKTPASSSSDAAGRRSGRKRPAKDDNEEMEDVDVEKEDVEESAPPPTAVVTPSKAKRGRKAIKVEEDDKVRESRSKVAQQAASPVVATPPSQTKATPTKELPKPAPAPKSKSSEEEGDEDPYAFKEPEPFDEVKFETPRKGGPATPTSVTKKEEKTEKAASPPKGRLGRKRESDSTDSSSDETAAALRKTATRSRSKSKTPAGDTNAAPTTPTTITETSSTDSKVDSEEEEEPPVPHQEITQELKQEKEVETCKTDVESNPDEEPKIEGIKPLSPEKADLGKPVLQLTKKQQELFPYLSAIRTAQLPSSKAKTPVVAPTPVIAKPPIVPEPVPVKEEKSDNSSSEADVVRTPLTEEPSPSKPKPARGTPGRKRKTPRKPNSSEIVESESESDSNTDPTDVAEKAKSSKKKAVFGTSGDSSEEEEKTPLIKKPKKKKDEQDEVDLVCGETFPGSPVRPAVATGQSPEAKPSSRLGMPFATVPESGHGPIVSSSKSSAPPATLPPRKAMEDLETPDTSSASQSPRDNRPQVVDKDPVGGESELDLDSLSGRKMADSEDSKDEAKKGTKRKADQPRSPAPMNKRKRRTRGDTNRGRKGRHPSAGKGTEETDDSEENKDPTHIQSIINKSDQELAALQRSPKSSKYNFYVELDSTMDSSERINRLQQSLEDLRKTYMTLKGELAVIERRRKKIRRKERERGSKSGGSNSSQVEVAA